MSDLKMYLYGKGGHANVIQDVLESGGISVVSVFDDDSTRASIQEYGLRLRSGNFPQLDHPLIVSIGDNGLRAEIVGQLNCEFGIAIHTSATIASSVTIGEGTVVLHGAIIQAQSTIGKHVLVNTGASIDHDNEIGNFVHVSPQAVLCGHVKIGEGTHVGAAAVVIPSVKIGKWCTIGAGSIVIQDIPDYCTVVGNPARVIKQNFPVNAPANSTEIHNFDLVLVGSGLASTITVVNLLQKLKRIGLPRPVTIGILESRPERFAGVAYGSFIGTKSLIITELKEFLPEPELSEFKNWLTVNKGWAFDAFRVHSGEKTQRWLEVNSVAIANNDWDRLYLPRYLFGIFLESIGERALNEASQNGLIQFRQIEATVTDIERTENCFRISCQHSKRESHSVTAKQIVLAIGSPPFRQLFNENLYSPRLGGLVIDNPYRKGFPIVIERIVQHLKMHDRLRFKLLLIGSNATTIETLYNLCEHNWITERLERATIISPSCELPTRVTPPDNCREFACCELRSLDHQPNLTAEQIYLAAKSDINSSKRQGFKFSDSFEAISDWIIRLISNLSFIERQKFVAIHGVEIGRLQRRAGGEYSDAVDELKLAGKLSFQQGRFLEITENSVLGLKYDFCTSASERVKSGDHYQVVINCAGFETVSNASSNPIIRNLLKRKLAQVNSSNMGFVLDNHLAASKQLYVVGPLMAGNVIGEEMIWHAEHCGRIIRFSDLLAQHLASEIELDFQTKSILSAT